MLQQFSSILPVSAPVGQSSTRRTAIAYNSNFPLPSAVCHLLFAIAICCTKLPPTTKKSLLNLSQAAYQPFIVYRLIQAVPLLSRGWVGVWMGVRQVITRFKANSVQIDWTSQLELSLPILQVLITFKKFTHCHCLSN